MNRRFFFSSKLLIFVVSFLSILPSSALAKKSSPSSISQAKKGIVYPHGPQTGTLYFQKEIPPGEMQVNVPFDYQLVVQNLTSQELRGITIIDQLPTVFKMNHSGMAYQERPNREFLWEIPKLQSKETKIVVVNITAEAPGEFTSTGRVTYDQFLSLTTEVLAPKLKMDVSLPAQALVCDSIPLRLAVTNTGTGTARGVRTRGRSPG